MLGDMLDDLSTYTVGDFVPFGAEAYARLFVQHNARFGVAPALGAVAGVAALWAAVSGRGRVAAALLAAAWGWVGWAFFAGSYAGLNWAGSYLAGVAGLQGVLMAFMAWRGWLSGRAGSGGLAGGAEASAGRGIGHGIGYATGVALAVGGLALYPLLDPLSGRPWAGVELFGHAPEPTALVTLGLVLACGRRRLIGLTIPVLICGLGGVTARVLESPGWWVSSAAAAAALIALPIDALARRATG